MRTKSENDYRIFVGAFPTGEPARRIQALREHYDRRTARITLPHVTLAGTYWRSGPPTPQNEVGTIARLHGLQGTIPPFNLLLGGVRFFPPLSNPVIYLGVEVTSELLAARRILLEALGADKHRQFTPHLTLSMRLGEQAARAMLEELEASEWNQERKPAPIHELCLMQRGPDDPAWRTIYRLPLS